nr:MAG TPA: hypothetical protein [Caudoviricetes sp.]
MYYIFVVFSLTCSIRTFFNSVNSTDWLLVLLAHLYGRC